MLNLQHYNLMKDLWLLLVETGGTVLAAAMPGKIKTFTQMFSIIFLLLHWTLLGQILLYIAC